MKSLHPVMNNACGICIEDVTLKFCTQNIWQIIIIKDTAPTIKIQDVEYVTVCAAL